MSNLLILIINLLIVISTWMVMVVLMTWILKVSPKNPQERKINKTKTSFKMIIGIMITKTKLIMMDLTTWKTIMMGLKILKILMIWMRKTYKMKKYKKWINSKINLRMNNQVIKRNNLLKNSSNSNKCNNKNKMILMMTLKMILIMKMMAAILKNLATKTP